MGLRVCRTEKNRPRTASLPEEVRDGASFRATRCLLRRTHLRHHSLCQNLRRGRHFLPRFHFPVPVGEQVRYLSSEIPRDYLQPSRPKYLPLLRDRPGRLFLPVLPVREGGKLTFPLCRSCVREEMAKKLLEWSNMCGHTREQRMLRGTWCIPEL